jgi:Predicted UDP-glucose 6-dehydrogenase
MHVCVIGTGYVGLVTGTCLAHIGHHVICVDNNEEKVKLMKSGHSPIFEPGLSELMSSASESGNLEFTSDLAAGVAHGDILFIAVGTPPLPTGESDTRYVEAVARGIGAHLDGDYKVIVNKSTVPIGSGDWVRRIVLDGLAERQKPQSGDKVTGEEVAAKTGVHLMWLATRSFCGRAVLFTILLIPIALFSAALLSGLWI